MNKPTRTLEWLVWGGLILTIVGIAAAFIWTRIQERASGPDLPIITQQLPDFTLTNQHGQVVTPAALTGQVWVADIIFTRCPGPCAEMTRRMSELQRALPANGPVKLLTLTTDPEFDTPEVLKRYGERFGAEPNRWMFLTGAKPQIARLAIDGLKLAAVEKKPEERESAEDLFIHSTIFVLVDKQGRLRGIAESTEPDFQQRVLSGVKKLLREK